MAKEKPTTKLCKHCKTEIPYDAKVCPHCRKKQKKGLVSKIIIALIVLAIISSALGDDTDDSDQKISSNTNVSESSDTKGETSGNEEESKESDNVVTVGSSFTVGDLNITINDADTNFTDYENDYGINTPDDGMKYIMVSFTFENIGKSGDEYVSIYDFDCYADNASCEQVYTLDDNDFINTNLSAGRNVSFKTYYAVPSDSESIELEYDENVWTSDKILIKIQ